MLRRRFLPVSLAAALALTINVLAPPSQAETGEVRIAQQFGLAYMPLHAVIDQKLIEKHARAAGLGDIKVTLAQFSSGAAVNDALLSGNVDLSMGGVTVLATIWDKTRGRGNVRGMMAISDSPIYFNTSDPRIRTIRDFTDSDRIAVTAVKVTHHAVLLQMAAAREFGWDNRFKLDPLTVSMAHPDAMTAMLAPRHEVRTHAATIPFLNLELADPRVRTVLNSYEVSGGRHTLIVAFNTEKWKRDNPKTYAAVAAALTEGMAMVNRDKRAAAELYRRVEKTRLSQEEIEAILRDENLVYFSPAPSRFMLFAEFMHKNGTLSTLPPSWKDFFWENMHDQPGS